MTSTDARSTLPGVDGSLTGSAAVEALGLYVRLGSADARFDRRRVADAARTRAGRSGVYAALSAALRAVRAPARAAALPRPAGRERAVRRVRSGAASAAAPARPRRARLEGGR